MLKLRVYRIQSDKLRNCRIIKIGSLKDYARKSKLQYHN